MSDISKLFEFDQSVRARNLKTRALQEEAEYGISSSPPIRRPNESNSYWFIRKLTFEVLGMSYRVPQLNLYLLEDFINEKTFGKFRVVHCVYVPAGEANMRFYTKGKIRIDFYAHAPIDPNRFLNSFGIG